jgi:hypothetical protein
MDSPLLYLIGLPAVALAFDVLNGLHDAANSIATIVSTRVLPQPVIDPYASSGLSGAESCFLNNLAI